MHPLDHSQHYLKVVKGSYIERDFCGSRDPINKKVLDFINALLNDAKNVANDLDVTIRIYSDYQLLKKNLSSSMMHRFCMKTFASGKIINPVYVVKTKSTESFKFYQNFWYTVTPMH
jgi:hypothetical protein